MIPDETPSQRQERHNQHQRLMFEHRERKALARERHKFNHGRKRPYPGHF